MLSQANNCFIGLAQTTTFGLTTFVFNYEIISTFSLFSQCSDFERKKILRKILRKFWSGLVLVLQGTLTKREG
jgi:hypothetical protein